MNTLTQKVSVVIPNFNYGHYLKECINSVLEQTYPHIEVIVVDDGSTDNSVEVARSFGDLVNVVCQSNRGQAAARNVGIRASSGSWIAFLDSDDMIHPKKIQMQMDALNRNMGIEFLGTNLSEKLAKDTELNDSLSFVDNLYFLTNTIAPSSVIINKHCFNDVGFFNEKRSIQGVEDKDFFLRLSLKYKGAVLNAPLVMYRKHAQQTNKKYKLMLSAEREVLQTYFKLVPHSFTTYCLGISKFHYTSAVSFRDDGNMYAKSMLNITLSILLYPFNYRKDYLLLPRIKFFIITLMRLIFSR